MVEYRGINLRINLPASETSHLVKLMDNLPIVIQGLHKENGRLTLASDDNLASIKITNGGPGIRNTFILEPENGFALKWWQNEYLIREKNAEVPRISCNPESEYDSRVMSEFRLLKDGINHALNVYVSPAK